MAATARPFSLKHRKGQLQEARFTFSSLAALFNQKARLLSLKNPYPGGEAKQSLPSGRFGYCSVIGEGGKEPGLDEVLLILYKAGKVS